MDPLTAVVAAATIAGGIAAIIAIYNEWAKRRKPPPPPRPIPQPPRRPEPRFISRHDQKGRDLVKRVSEALGPNGLVTVWGSGGVGKTTLAIEVAHRLCPSPYSGGVIWDSADGRADFALVTLLDKILTDVGREEARTLAPKEKFDLADRLLTEAMPCLLGLDNFETIAQEEQKAIIAFLDKLSCPVLVTSRESLRIGQNIRIGPMTLDEAREFLELRIEQSSQPDKLREIGLDKIAGVAERNPMLMRWVVAQLEQAMRPEDMFEDIARGRGEATDRIFGRTFGLLADDGQMALLALALFVPTASREALAAVCGFENGKDRANDAIRRLAAFDLLDTAIEGDRLGIVALTRRLTEAQLKEDERTEGLKARFVTHFLAYAVAHRKVTKEDLDALDEERENILEAWGYALTAEAREAWEPMMRITTAIAFGSLLDIRGYWDELLKWHEREVKWASHANFPGVAAAFSVDMGIIHHKRGDYTKAREAYQQALAFSQEAGDKRSVAFTLHNLGVTAQAQGNFQEARDLHNQSLEIERNLGDQAGVAKSLHQLGMLAELQGDYQEAKTLCKQSLQTFKDLGAEGEQAVVLHELGVIAYLQDDYQDAENLFNQSLEIARNLRDLEGIACSLHQLGMVAEDTRNKEEATRLYREALAIFERLGSAEAEKAHRDLARVTEEEPKE